MANKTITSPKGFLAAGVTCGIKKSGKPDLGLIVCPAGAKAAAVFTTNKITDLEELSQSLTASAHLGTLKWDSKSDQTTFISQCNYCHQIGNSFTRLPRDKETWDAIVDRMEGYMVLFTDDEKESISKHLHHSYYFH